MKKITSFILAAVASLLFCSSCSTNNPVNEKGKWSFTTLSGDKAEIWMDGRHFASIRSNTNQAFIFNYKINGDTVNLYRPEDSTNVMDHFIVAEESDSIMNVVQDGHKNTLKLIDRTTPDIENTDDFKNSMSQDFQSRK